jgi:hypothetical protein
MWAESGWNFHDFWRVARIGQERQPAVQTVYSLLGYWSGQMSEDHEQVIEKHTDAEEVDFFGSRGSVSSHSKE